MDNPKVLTTEEIEQLYGLTPRQADFLKRQGFLATGYKQFHLRLDDTAYDFTFKVMLTSNAAEYEYEGRSNASPHILGPDGHAPKMDEIEYSYPRVLSPIGFMESDTPLGLNGSFYPYDITLMLLEKFKSGRAT